MLGLRGMFVPWRERVSGFWCVELCSGLPLNLKGKFHVWNRFSSQSEVAQRRVSRPGGEFMYYVELPLRERRLQLLLNTVTTTVS